jgi:hypothetical protein
MAAKALSADADGSEALKPGAYSPNRALIPCSNTASSPDTSLELDFRFERDED